MRILYLFKESFMLLFSKPRLFIPNLSASLLYAFVELILIIATAGSLTVLADSPSAHDLAALESYVPVFLGVLFFLPFIYVVDLVTYSMYPSMVSDYHKNIEISLWKAAKDAFSAWRVWMTFGLVFLLFGLFVFMLTGFFAVASFLSGNLIFLFFGVLIFIILLIFFMLSVFFVIPVAVIEKKGIIESFKESKRLGLEHAREVTFINVSIIFTVLAAFLVGNLYGVAEMSTKLTFMAASLFILVKIIQSMLYTYVLVVNPFFYIKASEQKDQILL